MTPAITQALADVDSASDAIIRAARTKSLITLRLAREDLARARARLDAALGIDRRHDVEEMT